MLSLAVDDAFPAYLDIVSLRGKDKCLAIIAMQWIIVKVAAHLQDSPLVEVQINVVLQEDWPAEEPAGGDDHMSPAQC